MGGLREVYQAGKTLLGEALLLEIEAGPVYAALAKRFGDVSQAFG